MIQAQRAKHTVLLNNISSTEQQTANFDCIGSDYATIVMIFGAEVNTNATNPTISLLESDDTVVTNFATFDTNFERATEDLASAKEVRYEIDMRARKRFLRLSITNATTTNDLIQLTALGVLTRNEQDPANTTDMGDDVVVIG